MAGIVRAVRDMARRLDKRTLIAKRKRMSHMSARRRAIETAQAQLKQRDLDRQLDRALSRER